MIKINIEKDVVLVNIEDIKGYEGNTKLHPPKQVKILADIIKRVGFNDPITLGKGNIVIAGHGRLLAAKELGMSSVPCIYKKDLSENDIRAYRIAHNKISETGYHDDLMADEFKLLLNDNDMESLTLLTAMSEGEILGYLNKKEELPGTDNAEEVDKLGSLLVKCPKCNHEFKKGESK